MTKTLEELNAEWLAARADDDAAADAARAAAAEADAAYAAYADAKENDDD